MNPLKVYPYSSPDGFKNPQTYQYSTYQGLTFIQAYQELRIQIMDTIKSRYLNSINTQGTHKNILAEYHCLKPLLIKYLDKDFNTELTNLNNKTNKKINPNYKTEQDIKNKKIILHDLLKKILKQQSKKKISTKQIYNLLSILIKKYEVRKKLYTEYNKDFKNTSEDYQLLNNYILLSLNLLLYYQKYENLKFINTSLKLNDLICSVVNKINSPQDMILAYLTLKIEQDEIKELFKKQGL